jgi:hypothetical protein
MKAKDAKKMVCACKIRQGKKTVVCSRKAIVTFRIETESSPEFMTFCCDHLETAEKVIHEIRKTLK